MEAKIEKEKRNTCGCFHGTFYHLALYFFIYKNERESFWIQIPLWDYVARFHPHCLLQLSLQRILSCTWPCIIGVVCTPFWPLPDSWTACVCVYASENSTQIDKQKKNACGENGKLVKNLWKIWWASYPKDKPKDFASLKETCFAV